MLTPHPILCLKLPPMLPDIPTLSRPPCCLSAAPTPPQMSHPLMHSLTSLNCFSRHPHPPLHVHSFPVLYRNPTLISGFIRHPIISHAPSSHSVTSTLLHALLYCFLRFYSVSHAPTLSCTHPHCLSHPCVVLSTLTHTVSLLLITKHPSTLYHTPLYCYARLITILHTLTPPCMPFSLPCALPAIPHTLTPFTCLTLFSTPAHSLFFGSLVRHERLHSVLHAHPNTSHPQHHYTYTFAICTLPTTL